MAALPIAMLGATVLAGAAGWASLYSGESEKDGIQLKSGQYVRIQSRVRLSEDGKKNHPDSCLVASEDGTVTKVDVEGRKATVRCNKNRRAAPEEIPAEDLEVIDSGINAPGISIAGGYVTEGASVRMLDSSKRTNKGKALASPFYNPVGTVMAIDKVQKQLVVLSNHLNNKSTAQEFYNIDDLEFVSGPSADARKGAEAGLKLKIGSTVELTDEAKKKYGPGVVNSTFNKPPEKKLADPKWEKFGIVKSITVDPKNPRDKTKLIVIVRCVSKDSKKEVLEQKYDIEDLKAIPAISVERAGIAVFGGMAEMDTKVKLRAERKSAVASKSLGRSAFGDTGTVSDLEPNDPNNLKVFVTCNGINPDEQTGDWYQPEDLEVAEPEDTEGEAVFGGRVVVGSTVRVMQSARGKKCLGTPEFGDVGTVKGIDPSAPDNLRINVTCGRSDAKESEWYDPRDLSLYFPVDESGSELEKAKVALAAVKKELSEWQLRPQEERRSDQRRAEKKELEAKVAAAQAEVDRLSGVGLDKTKASEMRNDSEEKLDEAMKLKRELEALRLKLSRDSTCKKPERSIRYKVETDKIVSEWLTNMRVNSSNYADYGFQPLQYSNSYRVALTELQTAFRSLNNYPEVDDTYTKYKALNAAKLALRNDLKKERSDTESFANLDDTLLDVAKKQKDFDDTASTPYKTALNTIDDKLKKLQEVATQIQSAAYSGDSPAEKLLKRVEDLEKKTNGDIADNATKLKAAVTTYETAFKNEQSWRLSLDVTKHQYDDKVLSVKKKGYVMTDADTDAITEKFELLEKSRLEYLKAQKETLKARKEQALLSAKTTCSEITLESVKDMKEKIEKIISGKCGVLTTIDELLEKVNDLISKRKQVFTMSQAVLDPKFGDPDNAIFEEPITSPEDRIKQIQSAMTEVESKPTLDNLKLLTNLCGRYDNDGGLLDAAIKIKFPAPPEYKCPDDPGVPPPEPKVPKPQTLPTPTPAPAPASAPAPGTSRTRRTGSQVLDDLAEDARIRNEKLQEANRRAQTQNAELKAQAEQARVEAEAAKAELESAPPAVASNPMRPAPPAPAQMFFQKQRGGLGCGRIAINNIIGREVYDIRTNRPIDFTNPQFPINMIQFCDEVTKLFNAQLQSKGVQPADIKAQNPFLCEANENYNFPILVSAMGLLGFEMMGDYGDLTDQVIYQSFLTTESARDRDDYVYLFNLGGAHWTSAKKIGNSYFYFDGYRKPETALPEKYSTKEALLNIVSSKGITSAYNFANVGHPIPVLSRFQDIITSAKPGGKRKWPFYGRRTTRRGGGVEEAKRVRDAKRNLDAHPYDPRFQQKYNDALAAKRASEAVDPANPFNENSVGNPATRYIRNPVGQAQQLTDAQIREDVRRAEEAYARPQSDRIPLEPDSDLPPPLPPAQPDFDRAENKRQFDEAIRATEEKVRLQLEKNQEEYDRQLAENQRVQDQVIKELRMVAAKGAFDAKQEATRKELQRKEAEIEERKKKELEDLLIKNKGVRYRAEEELQRKVGNFKHKYDSESRQKKIDKAFDTIENINADIAKDNTREAEKKEAERRKEQEEDEALFKRVREEREAFLKTKEQKDLDAELLAQGGPELLAAWKKEQKAKAEGSKMMAKIKARNEALAAKNEEYRLVWEKYDDEFNKWLNLDQEHRECIEEYSRKLAKYNEEKKKLIRDISKDLGDDQILRLQSRGVGSSLMLDEARKLMIDADEQQRTVMESKTDLQFTLASSSDADIAKAVGFYEAELQKLKTCISKGKEDAIAEYEKDLAEIEKKKKEITAKTFEVKAPQEDKKNKKKLEDMNLDELYAEKKRLQEEKKTRLSRKPTASVQDLDDRIKKAVARITALNNPAPASTPGGRRFTRRRRV